jgi:cellulose synthase/poly-beta-1,6-N-acetylglucosamine synthase-like glycosyltransferase
MYLMIIGLIRTLKDLWGYLNRRAMWLFGFGLGLALVVNLLTWRRDRQRLERIKAGKKPRQALAADPLVSILVPAWNEAHNIVAFIQSGRNLRYPNVQLVLCAGGEDGTLDLARHYDNETTVVLEQFPGDGKQGALRRCLRQATGEILFLTDADCLLDDRCFEGTLGPIINDGQPAATGAWRPLDQQLGKPFVQYQWAHHRYREVMLPDLAPTLDGRNAALTRQALLETGGFAANAPIGTDYVLSRQLTNLGYRIAFVRQSLIQTVYPETPTQYWQQQSRWFRNWLLLRRQWGEEIPMIDLVRATIPALFLLSVPALGRLVGPLLWAVWGAIFCHLALSTQRFAAILWLSEGKKPQVSRALSFVVYLPVGWVATLRGLLDTVRSTRSSAW